MAAIINITGRLAFDPETRNAGSSSVTKFKIPVDTGWKEGEKFTTWWLVEVWGKRGQTLQQHVGKGSVIQVWGEACVREYSKSDGSTGYSPEIKNASWDFTPKVREESAQGGGDHVGGQSSGGYGGQQGGGYGGNNSGIPF
jgi:single-strand DNA-binding protein